MAQKFIDWILTNPWPNGMLGPQKNDDWWPRMVMLKVLTQHQEATGDRRVIPVMQRYFSYQLQELPKRPLRDWGKYRIRLTFGMPPGADWPTFRRRHSFAYSAIFRFFPGPRHLAARV